MSTDRELNSLEESTVKFDVYLGTNYPFRVLSNVTREELDLYCSERGYTVTSIHRRGVTYFDAFITKA